jgi:F0F1-type ATP synthase membrane subunit b/b'
MNMHLLSRVIPRVLQRAALVAVPLAFVGVAAASDGHGPPWTKIGLHAFNLVALLAVLGFLARKAIRDGLATRTATIRTAIEASDKALAAAQARFTDLEAQVAGLEHHLADMRKEAEVDAGREREHLLARADAECANIAESAQRSIRGETDRARTAVRRHAAELAVQLASEQVAARINDADHARLTREFLSAVSAETNEVGHG